MRPNFIPFILLVFVSLNSCKNKTSEVAESKSNLIEITKEQFQAGNMKLGEPEVISFSEEVHFTGTICPSTTGIAQISLPVAGIISKIKCTPGMLVRQQQVLFEVSGNEIIDLQREFAESTAKLVQLESNFKLVSELYADNVGTKQELILAESAYKSEQAKNTALQVKLENIGLDISKIKDGFFYPSYSLKAPLKAYVTNLNATIGQYVEPQLMVVELINPQQLQLRLSIFEKEINKLEVGQAVEFYLAGDKSKTHKATLNVVGKTMNPQSKAVECYAAIADLNNSKLVANQFAEGKISVDTNSVLALPETALSKSENETYVLTLANETDESYFFDKVKVNTGRKNKNFVELTNTPKLNTLLVKGAYNIPLE